MLYTTELRGRNLHIALKMVYYLAEQVITCITTKYTVITVCVCQLPEILVCLYQGLGILGNIAEMHIVICQSMTNKQAAMQLRSTCNWRYIITRLIFLWCTHITLCVDSIIVAP